MTQSSLLVPNQIYGLVLLFTISYSQSDLGEPSKKKTSKFTALGSNFSDPPLPPYLQPSLVIIDDNLLKFPIFDTLCVNFIRLHNLVHDLAYEIFTFAEKDT